MRCIPALGVSSGPPQAVRPRPSCKAHTCRPPRASVRAPARGVGPALWEEKQLPAQHRRRQMTLSAGHGRPIRGDLDFLRPGPRGPLSAGRARDLVCDKHGQHQRPRLSVFCRVSGLLRSWSPAPRCCSSLIPARLTRRPTARRGKACLPNPESKTLGSARTFE